MVGLYRVLPRIESKLSDGCSPVHVTSIGTTPIDKSSGDHVRERVSKFPDNAII